MRRIPFSLALAAVLVACSCAPAEPSQTMDSEKGGPAPTATSPPTTPPAPTTTASPGFEVPSTIDVPYVQRVLDEIYRLEGEAARHLYAKKVPDAEFNERLEAIFAGPALEDAKTAFGRDAAEKLVNFAEPPGNPLVKVISIDDATSDCLVVRAMLTFNAVYKRTASASPDVLIQLVAGNVEPLNPTPWGVVAAGPPTSATDIKVCQS